MSLAGKAKAGFKNALFFVPDLLARVLIYRKKNICPARQIPMLLAHRGVLKQNMKNFVALYGSRREAVKRMSQITGGTIRWL